LPPAALEGPAMKKQDKQATKRNKKRPTKDLSPKAASAVKGGAVAGQQKWTDITLKQ
jgi:hypothetical protein